MSEDLIENAVFTVLEFSNYSLSLSGEAKARYLDKLQLIGRDVLT